MPGHGEDEECDQGRVNDDDAEAQTRQKSDVAFLLRLELWQLGAASRAIDTGALVSLIGTVAGLWVAQSRFHPFKALVWHREVDLEGTAQEGPLVAQELEELSVVLRSTSNEVNRLASGSTKLDVLAAVVKASAILRADQLVEFGNQVFVTLLLSLSDVDKQ